jgi:hypothetical protein
MKIATFIDSYSWEVNTKHGVSEKTITSAIDRFGYIFDLPLGIREKP